MRYNPKGHAKIVFDTLAQHEYMTDSEISNICGLSGNIVRPSRIRLVHNGMVRRIGFRDMRTDEVFLTSKNKNSNKQEYIYKAIKKVGVSVRQEPKRSSGFIKKFAKVNKINGLHSVVEDLQNIIISCSQMLAKLKNNMNGSNVVREVI